MAFLIGFLIVILILVSILLILIVLAQDDGAEGAGMLLGSSASQQYGARKGNIVTRTTGILATLFISVSLVLVFLFRESDTSLQAIESEVEGDSENQLVEWWAQDEATDTTTDADGEESEAVITNDVSDDTEVSVETTDTDKESGADDTSTDNTDTTSSIEN